MKPPIRRTPVILIFTALVFGQIACAHAPKHEPPALSGEVKAQMRTIGVVSSSFQPAFIPEKLMTKKRAAAAGAGVGALRCLNAGFAALGTSGADPLAGAVAAIIGLGAIALTPVGAAVGGVVGAVSGVTETETADAESVLNLSLKEVDIQRTLQARLLSIAQEKTSYSFVPLEDKGPSFPQEEVSYRPVQPEVSTILEISVLEVGLSSISDGPGINPPLSLLSMGRIRVLRVSSDEPLYTHTFTYVSKEKKKFTGWAENQGQPLKDELGRCLDSMAG